MMLHWCLLCHRYLLQHISVAGLTSDMQLQNNCVMHAGLGQMVLLVSVEVTQKNSKTSQNP